MTRFERELSGELGAFWKKDAEKELERVKADLEAGKITIDENGVARNCIGRVLMDDMLEKVQHLTDKANTEATRAAREAETAAFLEEYRKNYQGPTEEEKIEMRAAFGEGETVFDIITGKRITL
ncbi:MAG: hypothetical protein LKF15_10565 [Lachnospiraceae bacterium]|jgi:diphthamide synthase (EF-2-diphthine--ammonia ligase)|nr:hypothetical protein [Lachnospiraceae bacterium]MCH4067228.1 hypothetical protein [Lachnospiraceae bacterium]MCH4113254.1 hypothetical protein [Lachnospiraceae bacterium]